MNDNHQNTEGYRRHAELRNKGLLWMNKLGNSAIKNTMGLGLNNDTSTPDETAGWRKASLNRQKRG